MPLTICICGRDAAEHVDRCLRALIAETAPYDTPIVVVDHASCDDTPALLARWARTCPDRLRVLRFDGEGIAAARNYAWRQSQTDWLAFIDIDVEVQPGWAAAAYAGVQDHDPDAQCGAFGGANRVAQDGSLLCRAYSVLLATYVGGHDSILNRPAADRRRVDHCPTLNVVYRRSALDKIDGFDPAYTRLAEDVDVSWRLVRSGYTLWANPLMAVEHRLRPTLRSWLRNMYLYGRGRCYHLKRHPADLHLKFLAPAAVVLAYLAAALWGIRHGWPIRALTLLAGAHVASIAALLAPEARRQGSGVRAWIVASVVVWLTHLAYGCGLLAELPRRRDKFVL